MTTAITYLGVSTFSSNSEYWRAQFYSNRENKNIKASYTHVHTVYSQVLIHTADRTGEQTSARFNTEARIRMWVHSIEDLTLNLLCGGDTIIWIWEITK